MVTRQVLSSVAVLLVAAGTVGCSPPTETLSGMVIDTPGAGPRHCASVMESYPPQCGDATALSNWSWDELAFEEASGVRWAWVEMDGVRTADGFRLTGPARNSRP